jgi:prepilin-type N-terminal cleavage/methylation domain-containing protein
MKTKQTEIKQNRFGFSLFELLVVISIIGIIIAVGTVSYSSAQKRARDARRREDLQAVQKAFEQYYSVNDSVYNASCTEMAEENFSGQAMPTDPKNSGDYVYDAECQTFGYCVCAQLEDDTAGNSTGCSCGASECLLTTGGTTHYCITNLQ